MSAVFEEGCSFASNNFTFVICISLFYEWSKFPFQKRSTYYLYDCLSRWFGSTKCKLHKQLYQNAQTKLRRHCLEKKKSKPTPPPHQRCTAMARHCTVSAVQKIKKERITLCMVWCARVQIPFEFRWLSRFAIWMEAYALQFILPQRAQNFFEFAFQTSSLSDFPKFYLNFQSEV